jgi:hypothetical protein
MWRKLPATMTFSAQLMNGFQILFKPLVIFTPHFPAILENSGLGWKTPALLQFRHLTNPVDTVESLCVAHGGTVVFRPFAGRERYVTFLSRLR